MKAKTRKRMIMMLAAVLTTTALTAACSNSPEETTGDKGNAEATANLTQTGLPIVKEPVTLKVFGCKDPNHADWKDVLIFQEYEKMTNVKLQFDELPSNTQGCDEKRSLLFAANELPDIFLRANLSNTDIARYGQQEKMLIPLEDLIDKHAPNLKKIFEQYPEVKKTVTAADGHIYSLPTVRLQTSGRSDKIWINKEWLAKLNMKAPTNTDELFTVLRAFRDNDPNGNGKKDEIPLGLRDIGMVYSAFSGAFGLEQQMGYQLNIKDDQAKIWLTDDRFKELLQFLNKLYGEKLLWQDFYAGDIPKWRSNLSQALIGMFFIQASDPFLQVENQFTGMAPIKGPYGDQTHSATGPIAAPIGTFAISKENKHPEAAIRWVDYFYSEEGSKFFQYGVEGQTYTMKDGKPVINDAIKNDPRGFMAALGQVNLVPGGSFPHVVTDKFGNIVENDKVLELNKFIESYLPKTVHGAPIFDKETSDAIIPIKADIDKYVRESVAKFIIGELSFDKWGEYVATLKKMKIDELEKAYQKAYDAKK
ncbi:MULTISPECIES: extracellular solute-binding protein [unclassified Paenibacillus]|uniref:extracellular solute-binding protein n=1 Tax=unclassified Paenibacillus TaxID=185978 RepID=UPI00093051E5|nr:MULTISPECIES: extracellular solute-binding protein [unclassified Paenibacillus]